MYNCLCNGSFGDGLEDSIAELKAKSRILFPYALVFKDAAVAVLSSADDVASIGIATDAAADKQQA